MSGVEAMSRSAGENHGASVEGIVEERAFEPTGYELLAVRARQHFTPRRDDLYDLVPPHDLNRLGLMDL